ncbi:RsmB/NOP family class I SAM-dependent RNA methyltransferase [Actinocatenispora sera]|uniref:SAM-dependent MTase RsmB/NOP-type domain-containing protein n=1 Tax=Actinocatenispora sera TaxID=390989 RepID=A0A810L899_9ACTN|nr:transcription antitermination factor NusB [Actinocatenispora sera]BCJ30556.1 hypothetical protein Asera_46640 [Actinocatenispora sera]
MAGAKPTDRARRAAYEVLRQVHEQDAYANLALPKLLADWSLAGRDAAFATELCYGTLRATGTLDAVLAAGSNRPLAKMDDTVRDALRLGAYQLLYTRVPAHAAVSTTVGLVRSTAGAGSASFANAVLRRVAGAELATWLDRIAPDAGADPIGALAVRYAHPEWIVRAFAAALDDVPPPADATRDAAQDDAGRSATEDDAAPADAAPDEAGTPGADPAATPAAAGAAGAELRAALAADNDRPVVHLAARPGAIDAAELARRVGGEPGRYSPYAVYLPGGAPGELPELRDGLARVQDEGSQLVATALAAAPLDGTDTSWLDLCAGPGGKAALLGALVAGRGGRLTAVEAAEHRAALVRAAVAGLPVTVLHADGRAVGERPELPAGGFDRVLLDAPCTGLGALRRRPEARWRRSETDLADLVELQRELLVAACRAVRPGGVLGYVTCSPHLAETREQVRALLADQPVPLSAVDARPALGTDLPQLGDGPTVQLWPHRHGTDAMFLALLRRIA